MSNEYEVLVIGGGPAGLSAALYLARYARRTALFDTSAGRSSWHQINYNYLGFPGGIPAREIRQRGRQQLADYEYITLQDHRVESLRREQGMFYAQGQAGTWQAPAVIICTGVIDHFPKFDGWEEYVGRSMFWCITCDGFGCRDSSVLVVGNTNAAASMALQLTRFTTRVNVVTDSSDDCRITDTMQRRLRNAQIHLYDDRICAAEGSDGKFTAVLLESGTRLETDQLFAQHGATPQTRLAEDVGALLSQEGYICVDTEQKTNVAGLYAAGDVTRLHSHQVSTAVHEGGTAASAANYFLYPPELKDD